MIHAERLEPGTRNRYQALMSSSNANPLLAPSTWNTPFQIPPFESIRSEHFSEALTLSMGKHLGELQSIGQNPDLPTFENTLIALENAGTWLETVVNIFSNLTSANTGPALQAVEAEFMPKLAAHASSLYLNAPLFQRINQLYQQRHTLKLATDELRLLERWHMDFVREGAKLQGNARKRFEEISIELANLCTQFSQNLQKDMAATTLTLTEREDLAGLPHGLLDAAQRKATSLGQSSAWVFQLNEPTVMEFVTYSERRELREKFWKLWRHRGENAGPHDNRPLIGQILALRLEQAKLLGFETYSDYAIATNMAKTPSAARDLLMKAWKPARLRALEERAEMTQLAVELGHGKLQIEEWDWNYYAEKIRQKKYQLDENEVRAFLPLPSMIQALFETAGRLFQLSFREIPNAPHYHPDVKTWEVLDSTGAHLGIFIGDYVARPSKRSGAWMSNYREQRGLAPHSARPIIVNCCNNSEPAAPGDPTLLGIDELRTLFHEFGHGLHGLLSQTRFPRLSGTNVLRDFVEFPSQILEHWALEPELLRQHARHYKTGEAIPDSLIKKIHEASKFNQGFATVEYTASALIDLDLHEQKSFDGFDPTEFEKAFNTRVEMPPAIKLRHRLPHFLHLFASSGYASQYYVYLWAGVLDADGFDAFREAGNPFAIEPARKLKTHIYEAGNTRDPMESYIAFRGRAPVVEPLLKQRGLSG